MKKVKMRAILGGLDILQMILATYINGGGAQISVMAARIMILMYCSNTKRNPLALYLHAIKIVRNEFEETFQNLSFFLSS